MSLAVQVFCVTNFSWAPHIEQHLSFSREYVRMDKKKMMLDMRMWVCLCLRVYERTMQINDKVIKGWYKLPTNFFSMSNL